MMSLDMEESHLKTFELSKNAEIFRSSELAGLCPQYFRRSPRSVTQ